MEVKVNNPIQVTKLRFGKFLPRAFLRANPLLGSWVSPTYINFPNRLIRSDLNTLRGRLHTSPEEDSLPAIVKEAFKEKWFNWQIYNTGQTLLYDKVQDYKNYKILLVRFDVSLFEGESGYRRFLAICAIIEYFSVVYKERLKVFITTFNIDKKVKEYPYNRYSPRYKSLYFTLDTVGLLGSLTILNKIYKLSRSIKD